ncbi:MAG: GGDEF domain-containing protein [Anaerolineales bacterium]|nr:GGDEF domain-containing protein [Anaerolineales bacterium]
MMRDRLYNYFRPRIEPEHRIFQTRFISFLCYTKYVLLILWFLYYLASSLEWIDPRFHNNLEILPIVLLAVLTTWLYSTNDKNGIVQTGIIISLSYLFTGIALVLFHPAWINLLVPILIVSITVVGTLIGGGLVYLIALINLLALTLVWFYSRSIAPDIMLFNTTGSILFLLMSAATLAGIAHLLYNISANMQRTLNLLNDRTHQLASLAHTDSLTQLANRRFLIEILEREFSRARRYNRPLSLIYLDLDGFKEINDQFGHLFGDEILRGASVTMKAVLRATDMLARIGGDEFAVLLPETDLEGSVNVARKLRRSLASYGDQLNSAQPESSTTEEIIPPLTFCSGVSTLHPEDNSIDDMLSRADDAQYLAKTTGKAHTRLETEI